MTATACGCRRRALPTSAVRLPSGSPPVGRLRRLRHRHRRSSRSTVCTRRCRSTRTSSEPPSRRNWCSGRPRAALPALSVRRTLWNRRVRRAANGSVALIVAWRRRRRSGSRTRGDRCRTRRRVVHSRAVWRTPALRETRTLTRAFCEPRLPARCTERVLLDATLFAQNCTLFTHMKKKPQLVGSTNGASKLQTSHCTLCLCYYVSVCYYEG